MLHVVHITTDSFNTAVWSSAQDKITFGVTENKNFLYNWYSFSVSSYLDISLLIAIIWAFIRFISATFSSLALVSASALQSQILSQMHWIHVIVNLLWKPCKRI